MSFWERLFGKNVREETASSQSTTVPDIQPENSTIQRPSGLSSRRIRAFISSTFRDMAEERDALVTHVWPELRRFCRERHVEIVEVDLRWGISEEQSTRKETLKLCLDEIHACRPYFIGLLGERYGWVPENDAFTADLREEQSWLKDLHGKSVTELEILHGVLNDPDMAGRSFFYFRDPAYARDHGTDFLPEDPASDAKQSSLKALIRKTCTEKNIPLYENYTDPRQLAALVLNDLKAAIESQFPIENIPEPLTRDALDHEAFAETRRHTYIGRPDYYKALDSHSSTDGGPLVLLGESGSGKSALLANWVMHWSKDHPQDFIFQHYIGGTPDSAEHWRLMTRLMAEIKRWCNDPEELPSSHDDVLKTFPAWLAKARIKAERDRVRFIMILDALNQLEDTDHARLLGWLPLHSFSGPLRLIVSTLPGETLDVINQRDWSTLDVQPLTHYERRRMIEEYLARFSKKLDEPRLERIASIPCAANPLYLKILLDELRVTGTHERLDERLADYLSSPDIPSLLHKVLSRYQHDYEHDRPGLIADALGLIWSARRGLTETEILRLLRPADLPQLPLATWAPLRSALEEGLVDRGGILNFAHDYLCAAVETMFVPDQDRRDTFRLHLADYFELQPVTSRSCDELPWLLWHTESFARLRACLLNLDRFLEICSRNREELMRFWVWLEEEQAMGEAYLDSFNKWIQDPGRMETSVSYAATYLAFFLIDAAALYTEAEPLIRHALTIDEQNLGIDHPDVARNLNNLAQLLQATNRLIEAEPLMRRALTIYEQSYGFDHPVIAITLNNLAMLLCVSNRLDEAELLMRRALTIDEHCYGKNHPDVARDLNNLTVLLKETNRLEEAEPLMRRALAIDEQRFGGDHPCVARDLNNLATVLQDTNRPDEAEPLMRRALAIDEQNFGADHPKVAVNLNNLAQLLKETNQLDEAEPKLRRALAINEQNFGTDHPSVAVSLNNLAQLLHETNRLDEAEHLLRRALAIDEKSYGKNQENIATRLNNLACLLQDTNRLDEAEGLLRRALSIDEQRFGVDHPRVAIDLNNLAQLLENTNRLDEAEPMSCRVVEILLKFTHTAGHMHPQLQTALDNYAQLLLAMDMNGLQVIEKIDSLLGQYGMNLGGPQSSIIS